MPPKKKAAEPKVANKKTAGNNVVKSTRSKTATLAAPKAGPRKATGQNSQAAGKASARRAAASSARAPLKAKAQSGEKSDKAAKATAKSNATSSKVKIAAKASAPPARKTSPEVSAAATKQNAGKVAPGVAKAASVRKSVAKPAANPKKAESKTAVRTTVETKAAQPKATTPVKPTQSKAGPIQAKSAKAPQAAKPDMSIPAGAAKTKAGTGQAAKPAVDGKAVAGSATNTRDAASGPRPAATQMVGHDMPAVSEKPVKRAGTPAQKSAGRAPMPDTKSVAAALLAARRKIIPAQKPANDAKPQANGGVEALKGGEEVADKTVKKVVVSQNKPAAPVPPTQPAAPILGAGMMRRPLGAMRPGMPGSVVAKPAKPGAKPNFKTGEFIVYPAHGVGEIIAIESQEVAGYKLELFVISFVKDKMILKVPLPKIASVGMRKLAEAPVVKRALDTLTGRARIKRTMWSRRAQEYEAKINSGDLIAIAEVVRDLYRSDAQPEQSYSERQLYEAALDRMARELSAVQSLTDTEALKLIDDQLRKGPRRGKAEEAEADEADDAEDNSGGMGEAA